LFVCFAAVQFADFNSSEVKMDQQTLKSVFIILLLAPGAAGLSCIDDKGSPVAWFTMLK
jgi:hypothetical protein